MKVSLTTRQRFEIAEFCRSQLRRFDRKSQINLTDSQEMAFYETLYDKMKIYEIAINELPKIARRKVK